MIVGITQDNALSFRQLPLALEFSPFLFPPLTIWLIPDHKAACPRLRSNSCKVIVGLSFHCFKNRISQVR